MRRLLHTLRSVGHDERGFTLIELLVAMVTGLVVSGALFAILEVSLHQTSRLADRVEADQTGRIAMTRVIDALHSTCISPEFRPIQSGSSATELKFITAYSSEATIPLSAVTEHVIKWEKESGKETGLLTDSSRTATGGSWPKYTFSGTATTTRLASNIGAPQEESKSVVFHYYKYATTSSSEVEKQLTPLSTLETKPLAMKESKEAEEAASVLVRFVAYPSNGNTASNRGVDLRNQITLAMSAPSSETPFEAVPCE
jgi:prepilin-type N-terminal cleavage/methylation domain-containing protein